MRAIPPNRRTVVAAFLALALVVLIALAPCGPRHRRESVQALAVPVLAYTGPETPSTTTTAETPRVTRPPRADRARPPAAPAPGPLAGAGFVNGYPCGGDLPPCWVLMRESSGSPRAVNARGCSGRGCHGLWQFDPLTWAGYGGYARADLAPPEVQNAKARALWAGGRGCSHWAACGRSTR